MMQEYEYVWVALNRNLGDFLRRCRGSDDESVLRAMKQDKFLDYLQSTMKKLWEQKGLSEQAMKVKEYLEFCVSQFLEAWENYQRRFWSQLDILGMLEALANLLALTISPNQLAQCSMDTL